MIAWIAQGSMKEALFPDSPIVIKDRQCRSLPEIHFTSGVQKPDSLQLARHAEVTKRSVQKFSQ